MAVGLRQQILEAPLPTMIAREDCFTVPAMRLSLRDHRTWIEPHDASRQSLVLRRFRHPSRLAYIDRARGGSVARAARPRARLVGLRGCLARRISGRDGGGACRPYRFLQA